MEPAGLARRLTSEGQKTTTFFANLPSPAWDQQVYTHGAAWNVRQILAHFLSAELAFGHLLQDVISGGEGAPKDLEIDKFNEGEVRDLEDQTPEDMVAAFSAARKDTAQIVASMSPKDLELGGWHPWFGVAPLANIIKLIYRHNMIHLRDIRQSIETNQPTPHKEIPPPSQAYGETEVKPA